MYKEAGSPGSGLASARWVGLIPIFSCYPTYITCTKYYSVICSAIERLPKKKKNKEEGSSETGFMGSKSQRLQ